MARWLHNLFCAFQPFLNSPQNSEYFEDRHIGWNKKNSPCRMPKTKSPAPPAPTKHLVPCDNFGVRRGGGGPPPPPLWGRVLTRSAPREGDLKTCMLRQQQHNKFSTSLYTIVEVIPCSRKTSGQVKQGFQVWRRLDRGSKIRRQRVLGHGNLRGAEHRVHIEQ